VLSQYFAGEIKMKVLFLITSLDYGGAETQLVSIATRLKKRGWDIQVVSMLPPKAFIEELDGAGIPLKTLNMRRGIPDPRAIFRLVRILYRLRPDIVHSHMVHANLLARIVRPLVSIPVLICTAHNNYEGGRYREIFYRLTDPLCDLTTQVSQAGLKRYIRVGATPRHKIRYVPNGVDTEKFKLNLKVRDRIRDKLGLRDSFIWLAVGRFHVQKDYPNLLNALTQVAREIHSVCLLIVGDGPLRWDMEQLAKELGLDGKVKFLGICSYVSELMNAADAFVLSSRWEGFGLVLVEAMACHLPIVATDSGGPREILDEGRLGFLVTPGESNCLASAMLKLMALPETKRKIMSQAGRAYIEANYSIEHIVDKWEELYVEFLRQKGYIVERKFK
jgi:glycosyltransferase involved in cell wall biosynthesis